VSSVPDLAPADCIEHKVDVDIETVEYILRCTNANAVDAPCPQAGTHLL
jgi:hypothetical protein